MRISSSELGDKYVPNHIARQVGMEVQRRIDALKIGQKMKDLPEDLWHESFRFYVKEDPNRKGGPNMRIIRLNPEHPSLTVTAYIFNKFVHPWENRYISVREAARLQGFPDSVVFEGTLTSTQLQVGNAVPVPLAAAVFRQIGKHAQKLGVSNKPLRAFSLFSGAGGMDIGAEKSAWVDTRVALEYWSDACNTLQGYYGNRIAVLEQDITHVDDPQRLWHESSGDIALPDIVYGGPPCQPFSQAGRQKALADERGGMIFHFLRFIQVLNPSYFVMENVRNLKGVGGGHLYRQILKQMEELGYNVTTGVMLAANFGAPQLRQRLFFLGCKRDLGRLEMPELTNAPEPNLFGVPPYITVGEAFAGLPPLLIGGKQTL